MKELSLHKQYALREDQEAANALVEKWCMNPHLYYFPSEELKFKPRLDRPSAEPPIFDYDYFMENYVPSDLQLEKLYPGNPVKKTMHSDFVVERRLLIDYGDWCDSVIAEDPARKAFYEGLVEEVEIGGD